MTRDVSRSAKVFRATPVPLRRYGLTSLRKAIRDCVRNTRDRRSAAGSLWPAQG